MKIYWNFQQRMEGVIRAASNLIKSQMTVSIAFYTMHWTAAI